MMSSLLVPGPTKAIRTVPSLACLSNVVLIRRENASAKSSCFSIPKPTICSNSSSHPCRGNLTIADFIEVDVRASLVKGKRLHA